MAEIVIRLSGKVDRLELLDVGCAAGHYLQSILKRLPRLTSVSYVGIDSDQKMIEAAEEVWRHRQREYPQATARFLLSNAEKMSGLELPRADIVFCANAFMYFARPQLALKGMLQASKTHCIIRSYFWNQTFIIKRAYQESLNESGEPNSYDHWNIYSETLFEQMVSAIDSRRKVQWEEDKNLQGRASMEQEAQAGIEKRNPTLLWNGKEVVYPFILPWKYAIISTEAELRRL